MKQQIVILLLLTATASPALSQQYRQLTDVPTIYIETEDRRAITSKEAYIYCSMVYVDGKVQLSYDNRGLGRDDWPYDDPFYVIFNLAWGGDWGGAQGVDESALPATMEVDYVRVFQKK